MSYLVLLFFPLGPIFRQNILSARTKYDCNNYLVRTKYDDKFTSISSSFAVMTDPMIPGMIW